MNAPPPPSDVADILVVDDTHANLQLLARMLKERGYKVRPALNGELALQAARYMAPDLILLDVNMPGLTGYEVAAHLKQDEKLRGVPIIFLSALNETLDKVRAFACGGVDYMTKPFQFEEVAARVDTHLQIRRLQSTLEARNRELQAANEELRRLQELRDNLAHMIVHDLRSPMAALAGYIDLCAGLDEFKLSKEGATFVQRASGAARKLLEMVNSLLDVNKMEAGQLKLDPSDCDLASLTRDVFAALESLRHDCQFALKAPAPCFTVSADRDLILRVLQNLIGNALKYAPEGTAVRVDIQADASTARVSVSDSGRGIAPEHHARIFEKFGQVERTGPRVGTGLGLTFCKLAIEAHGGRIGVQSEIGKGSVFWFQIPRRSLALPTH